MARLEVYKLLDEILDQKYHYESLKNMLNLPNYALEYIRGVSGS